MIKSSEIKIRIDPGKSGRKKAKRKNERINGTAPNKVDIKSVLKHSIKKITIHKITIIITTFSVP
ncbi:MAG TPA: hypothetical protein VKM55_20760 [Candidatus Lokiarchaeia archaeon]|nr:hypothetical protein [Candidatus Lokiarchaeia archaeon]